MPGTNETNKYGADKLALLGLLILAVLMARFIVGRRTAIVLSAPIELEHFGLSVSIPTGNGWYGLPNPAFHEHDSSETQIKWKFDDNIYTLSSFFLPTGAHPTTEVHCRFLLAAPPDPPSTIFSQYANQVNGQITRVERTQMSESAGGLTIDRAYIKVPGTPLDIITAAAPLPNNRQLDIEVLQTTGEVDFAEKVFEDVIKSIKFEDNKLLEAGTELVSQIKAEGIDDFLNYVGENQGQSRRAYFLIKDKNQELIGFTMDVLVSSDPNADTQLNIQAASSSYLGGRYRREQTSIFQSDDSFNIFAWRTENILRAAKSGTRLVLDETGLLTVQKLSLLAPHEKTYRLNPAAIPEVFVELLYEQMLESDHKRIIVDVIDAEGVIIPVLIYKIERQESKIAGEKDAYLLKAEFLDGQGFFQNIYLDSHMRISKIILHQISMLTFDRTSPENTLQHFPKHADYILKRSEFIE